MSNNITKEQVLKTYFVYTAIYIIVVLFMLHFFRLSGKSLFWLVDGLYQHYISFDYICQITEQLKHTKDLQGYGIFPFNYSIGQGADILTTLHGYDFCDPISWVFAFCFFTNRYQRYRLMILFKLYLIGVSFIVYYMHGLMRTNKYAAVYGATTYVFSGSVLFMFARHPNFVNWAFFLPFMLAGYERYKRKNTKWILIIVSFANILVNYYTFYIDIILFGIYILVDNVCDILKCKLTCDVKTVVSRSLKCFGLIIVGVLLSSAILFPSVYAFSINARATTLTGYTDSFISYPLEYYTRLIVSIFNPYQSTRFTTHIGIAPVVLCGIISLFITKGRYKQKTLFVLCIVMMSIPAIGLFMNGFGYVANRWSFFFSFVASLIFADSIPELFVMPENKKKRILIIAATYCMVCYLMANVFKGEIKNLTLALVLFMCLVYMLTPSTSKSMHVFMAFAVMLGSFFSVGTIFSENLGSYVSQFMNRGEYKENLQSSASAASNIGDSFYRVETLEKRSNVSSYNSVNGTTSFWSVQPKSIYDFLRGFELNDLLQNCNYKGLDGRLGLMSLASVKYYTMNSSIDISDMLSHFLTYDMSLSNEKYSVFYNDAFLPIVYTYGNYITVDEYNRLGAIDKENALLQAVVLNIEPNMAHVKPLIETSKLKYDIINESEVSIDNEVIRVDDNDGTVTMASVLPENCDIYFRIGEYDLHELDEEYISIVRSHANSESTLRKTGLIHGGEYQWPVERSGITFYMGEGDGNENYFTLHFDKPGLIEYGSIEIIALSRSNYKSYIDELNKYPFEDCKIDSSSITGHILVPEERFLQLSIPYSIGWNAFVDGEPTEVIRSDIMYMGVFLPSGEHDIVFRYSTPYMKEGAIVSIVTVLMVLIYIFTDKERKRKNGQNCSTNSLL